MKSKRIISKVVGLTQITIGASIMILAFLIFYDIFSIQAAIGLSADYIGLYLWALIIFGLLSVISGLFLFY